MKNTNNNSEIELLRQKAEELLKKKSEAKILELIEELAFQNEENAKRADELGNANANALKLTHELEVHQIELETLNDELVQAKEQAEIASKKYSELYDLAPTGHLTLSKEGKIIELNLTGTTMLGKERLLLKNSMFGFFVSNDTKPTFNFFLEKTFYSKARESCDVTLLTSSSTPVYIHLTGIVTENREQCHVTIVDITDRKLAELALQQIEARHSSMISNISDVIGIIGLDGFMKYKSPNIEKWFGWKPQDLVGTNGWLTVHPDDLARIQKEFFALLKKDNSVTTVEYKYKCKDGSYKPIELTATNLTNDPTIGGVLLNYHDITGRKLAEEVLKENEKKFRTVADFTYDWELWTGPDGRIIYISPSCERISGYKPEEFLSDKSLLKKILHPGDANLFEDYFRNINSLEHKHEIDSFNFRILKKDGSVAHIGHLSRPVFDEKGNYEGQRISNRDITQHWQMEEELKLAALRLELAVRAGGVGVWDYDIVNDVLIWDDQMFALYGITRKEFLGEYQAWQDGLHPDDKKRGDKEIQMAIRGEKEFDTEFIVTWPDGSVHNTRAVAVVQRDESGKALRMIGFNWDITELRKAEKEKLDDSESRYRAIFQGSPDGIIITEVQTKMIMFANPTQCEMLGYTEEELKTMTIAGIHPADTFPDTLADFESRALGNNINAIDIQCLRKNGEIFYADIASCLTTINGRKCIVAFFRDITERTQARQALQKSEELYKTVVSNTSDLLILSDEKGITTFCGPQCEKIIGYPGSKFIGQMMPDIIHPDDAEHCKQTWAEVFREGIEIRDFEYRIIDGNGGVRWVSHTVNFVTVNNKLIGIHNTIRNNTNRKVAEQAARLSEEKYKTMLNASPDAMVLINLKGIITEISEIGIPLFGENSRDDMIGKDVFQFVSADESDIFRELLEKTNNEGFTQNIGLTIKKKDQSIFTSEISATLMQDQHGAPISYMLIVRDVSHRKKMEAKQIHSDRMSTLGEMAAGIAHEINQPLNIISLVMDKILFETAKTEIVNLEFLQIKSDKIFENITRIRDIIDHVRAFSRSQEDFIPIAFDINSSIVNASSMIVEQFKHHGINLNLQLEPRIPQIVGNTYKFEQVILNLLANAKDAVTEKKIQQQDVEMQVGIRSWRENQCIFVDVTDNGIGISKDDIHKIMLPFYTTKEEGKGTGLGLSICYQIIKEMKGTIEITSDRKLGTKFQVVLPLQKKK